METIQEVITTLQELSENLFTSATHDQAEVDIVEDCICSLYRILQKQEVKMTTIDHNYFYDEQPTFMIKGNYIYSYNQEGSVYGMTLKELESLIIERGTFVEG